MKSQTTALLIIASALLLLLLLRRMELIVIAAPLALALSLLVKSRANIQQRKIGEQ